MKSGNYTPTSYSLPSTLHLTSIYMPQIERNRRGYRQRYRYGYTKSLETNFPYTHH